MSKQVSHHWKKLAQAQEKLLAAYRLGRRPAGSTLDAITAAKRAIAKEENEQAKVR